AEIEAVRRQVPGIEVLHGLEVDILADGALDLGDDALDRLDWVVISLHSRLDQAPEVITERVLRALAHPAVCVMGHPSARMIGTAAAAKPPAPAKAPATAKPPAPNSRPARAATHAKKPGAPRARATRRPVTRAAKRAVPAKRARRRSP